MPVTNGLLLLLLFFLAIGLSIIVVSAQAQATIGYNITVGSLVTTDKASSWISSSGRFAFGFYHEDDSFSVGIQLFNSSSENVVVWTARPELKRFSKDAFLNFTDEGFFVTPEKGAEAILLFNFSSTATSAAMLDNGNFVVYGSTYSRKSENPQVSLALVGTAPCSKSMKAYLDCQGPSENSVSPYNRGCMKGGPDSRCRLCGPDSRCRSSSSNSGFSSSSNSSSIIWRSFDFPTDTILGSQFLPCGYNLTSSAGKTNIGKYTLNLQCDSANLICYRLNSADEKWDVTGASGAFYSNLNLDEDGRLYLSSSGGNEKDLSGYKPKDTPYHMLYRATLDPDYIFRLYALHLDSNSTMVVNEIPYYKDKCQAKDICGVNSYCFLVNSNPTCSCMPGFEYINRDSQVVGCQRNKAVPSCSKLGSAANLSMETVDNIVGMDELAYAVISAGSQEDCSHACLEDCNCDAATFIDQKCSKLKLPLTSGRKDFNYPSVTFIKSADAGAARRPAKGQHRREFCIAAIFISVAVAIFIWIVVVAACIGAYWLLFGRFREEWRKWELALSEELAPRYFSYEELLKGPNESKQELGKGGHGTVFKADLPIGGKTVAVAVKRLHGAEMEGEREFQSEMRLVGRAYHINLVRLLGFCHDGPSRLLVYEFMSRGSLANHIFESRGRRPSWERRVAILLGAARGIHYLHRECETMIIHRDIKPENILIAEDWTAKISDFGLAKLLIGNQTRATTRTLAAGTEGYVAPECQWEVDGTGEAQVTEKADVYSYGVVVLETICGKRNREVKLLLCDLVRKSYEANELYKLLDGEQVEAIELEKLVKVGLLCLQEDPISRPYMEDVVMMLEGDIDVPTPPPVPLPL